MILEGRQKLLHPTLEKNIGRIGTTMTVLINCEVLVMLWAIVMRRTTKFAITHLPLTRF